MRALIIFLFPLQTNKWEDTPVAFDDWTRSHRHESHNDGEDNGDAGNSLHHDRILVRPPPCPINIRVFEHSPCGQKDVPMDIAHGKKTRVEKISVSSASTVFLVNRTALFLNQKQRSPPLFFLLPV